MISQPLDSTTTHVPGGLARLTSITSTKLESSFRSQNFHIICLKDIQVLFS
jgi:hypothetical protein